MVNSNMVNSNMVSSTLASSSSASTNQPALRSRERGASEVFMLILITSMISFAGLAYDAGMIFNARRQATNIAASAARTGANTVSTDALYSEALPKLANHAEDEAANAVTLAGANVVEVYRENDFEIVVKAELVHETIFLSIIGFDSFTVEGEANALVEQRAS